MFKPNENQDRKSYSELLMPPEGYQLEKAVGTTYSLDLEALTAVSVCLGLSEDADSKWMQNPISLLYALEQISDKILVFCEAGQIKVPSKPSALFLLLEKIIVPVTLPKDEQLGRAPAFHPKTWILTFVNAEGEKKYRFVVLSRNLTFDRSWDIGFAMESSDKVRQKRKTWPLLYFLDFLCSQISLESQDAEKKCRFMDTLRHELEGVSFALNSREFGEDFQIMPMGIGNKSYPMTEDALFCQDKTCAGYAFHELVVFSPFLSGSIIEKWNRKDRGLDCCARTLITRRSELGKLKETQVSRFSLYVLKDEIIDGEDYLSEGTMQKNKQDIHAKLYLIRRDKEVNLYLGSMNASFSALYKNVEMMVCLGTKSQYLNTGRLLNELFCGSLDGKNNPFEQVSSVKPKEDGESREINILEQKIKNLCRAEKTAFVEQTAEKYRIAIQLPGIKEDESMTISPLYFGRKQRIREVMVFEPMDMFMLSSFYEVCAQKEEFCVRRVIMIPTLGIPKEREHAVVSSIIKDRTSFGEYVSLILGDDCLLALLEGKKMRESGFFRQRSDNADVAVALYEKMLKAALDNPKRLKSIGSLMEKIDDKEIIPDAFKETYETFCRALKIK